MRGLFYVYVKIEKYKLEKNTNFNFLFKKLQFCNLCVLDKNLLRILAIFKRFRQHILILSKTYYSRIAASTLKSIQSLKFVIHDQHCMQSLASKGTLL